MNVVVVALGVTLGVEVPIVALLYPGQRVRMGVACAIATTVTNLALNLVLTRSSLSAYDASLLAGESLALISEALVYWIVAKPRDFGRAVTASAAANLASFGIGLLIF